MKSPLSYFLLISSLIFIIYIPSFAVDVLSSKQVKPTPLIGITGIDDITSAITEKNASSKGAIGMQRFFTTKLVAKLNNCTTKTREVFKKWYTKLGLVPESEKIKPNSMRTLIWDKNREGLFEATYVLSNKDKYIRAALDYYQLSGNKVSLTQIDEMIQKYSLNQLWGELSQALECD